MNTTKFSGIYQLLKIETFPTNSEAKVSTIQSGGFVFSEDGRVFMAQEVDGKFFSYYGTYTREGNSLAFKIEGSNFEHIVGTILDRTIEHFDGQSLIILAKGASTGTPARVHWKRVG